METYKIGDIFSPTASNNYQNVETGLFSCFIEDINRDYLDDDCPRVDRKEDGAVFTIVSEPYMHLFCSMKEKYPYTNVESNITGNVYRVPHWEVVYNYKSVMGG